VTLEAAGGIWSLVPFRGPPFVRPWFAKTKGGIDEGNLVSGAVFEARFGLVAFL
jgi:hypothetical protein